MVAQINEEHSPMVANAMAPTGQAGRCVDVRFAKLATGMGAITMHWKLSAVQGVNPRVAVTSTMAAPSVKREARHPATNAKQAGGLIKAFSNAWIRHITA
jgi:hypothetical protein